MTVKFADITADAPDFEALKNHYSAIEQRLAANDTSVVLAAIDQWDKSRRDVQTWQSLTHLRFNQDTRNEAYKQAREHCDELTPRITELDVRIKKKLVASPLREKLAEQIGTHCFALWESNVTTYDPVIEQDVVAEAKLEAEYNELLAAARLDFRGESLNHEGIDKYKFDGDRDTRYESMKVKWDWFRAHGEKLDDLYDRLVKLRDQMARKLGMDNYIQLGYRRMTRVDYDQHDVERYRAAVRDHVVPVCEEICRRKANTLGIDKTMFWDEAVHRPEGNPVPNGDHDWMIGQAKTMFDRIGYGLGDFFRIMADNGYLDLKNREGKAGGGFCTDLTSYGMPFVFANFNGTVDDVRVFTHEIGHAFQAYSSRDKRLVDYLWPTYDACEIHSMGLEFLTFPFMDLFFGDQAEVFCNDHLISSLMFLPYGVAVDHFQHLIYADPTASAAARHEMWQSVEKIYLPFRDYGDLPYVKDGGRWQLQRHIYLSPFYYIDYTLALACALQLWVRSRQDRGDTMRDYVALCERGGEAPFQQLAASANLVSPFQANALQEVTAEVKKELNI